MPDRAGLQWYTRGIHAYFPTWVITYDFSYYSRFPHNPDDFKDTVVSPAVRHVLNNEERMKSFAKGVQSQGAGAKKSGMFEKYLPYILIGILVILVVFVFQMHGQIGALTKAYNTLVGGK
jgi:hypothetical protein